MLTAKDYEQIGKKRIVESQITEQLNYFETGFPYLGLKAPAALGAGILPLSPADADNYTRIWEDYLNENHKIVKFVPASGAASRMFKDLFEFLNKESGTPETSFEKQFFTQIHRFAFYNDLNRCCEANEGASVDALIVEGRYKAVVENLLKEKGLNYGNLPKGLLKFHTYDADSRTAMEEHLAEGALYACNNAREVNVHFTVSPEHKALFSALVTRQSAQLAHQYQVEYNIGFSEQKSSTDTLAADAQNNPFRNADGSLLFRPGGHGALIENLNDIDADIIFVKNIDNVVPDTRKASTVQYKKIIGGVLVWAQSRIYTYMDMLQRGAYTIDDLRQMIDFMQQVLNIKHPEISILEDAELALYLMQKMNRPIRVCGMVKNEGEPGGGPFLAFNSDGTYSPQILESSQIDMNNPQAVSMLKSATHFNPVDLVCAVKDCNGDKYDLPRYVDKNTGFISSKSKDGKELKALELPGLWNGAMSDWNTIFVEVPVETFNPVKTVNDLLRDQHQ